MRADDLKLWRVAMGYTTQTEAARALGYKLSRYQDFERGLVDPLPRNVAFTCAALYKGLEPWPRCFDPKQPTPARKKALRGSADRSATKKKGAGSAPTSAKPKRSTKKPARAVKVKGTRAGSAKRKAASKGRRRPR